jgi:hypothetical protein
MSEQQGPNPPPGENDRHRKNRRSRSSPRLDVMLFPIGRVFIGEYRDGNGFQSFFRLRVIDSYAGPGFPHWGSARATEPRIYARVEAVSNEVDAPLVGHLLNVSIERQWWVGHQGPIFTEYTEADMVHMGYPWISEYTG